MPPPPPLAVTSRWLSTGGIGGGGDLEARVNQLEAIIRGQAEKIAVPSIIHHHLATTTTITLPPPPSLGHQHHHHHHACLQALEHSASTAQKRFSVFHYNVLADQYGSNLQPWFLMGAEPPVSNEERKHMHEQV